MKSKFIILQEVIEFWWQFVEGAVFSSSTFSWRFNQKLGFRSCVGLLLVLLSCALGLHVRLVPVAFP